MNDREWSVKIVLCSVLMKTRDFITSRRSIRDHLQVMKFQLWMCSHDFFSSFCSSSPTIDMSCTDEAVQRYPILIQVESALWLCASVILAVGLYKVSKRERKRNTQPGMRICNGTNDQLALIGWCSKCGSRGIKKISWISQRCIIRLTDVNDFQTLQNEGALTPLFKFFEDYKEFQTHIWLRNSLNKIEEKITLKSKKTQWERKAEQTIFSKHSECKQILAQVFFFACGKWFLLS